jgi:hypothetical protein
MSTWTSRLQPSPAAGVGVRPTTNPIGSRSLCVVAAVALLCIGLVVLLYRGGRHANQPAAGVTGSHVQSQEGLLSLPSAAQGSISAALGSDQAAYRVLGLVASNPAQGFSAQFGRSGVLIKAGSTRFPVSLKALGRGGASVALPAVAPVVSGNRVKYARASVSEWWANGPLGLEQGFDIGQRPAGSGALTLSLAMPAAARLAHGTVLLPGGLRYGGVHAMDATGRTLPTWLEMRGSRLLLRVADRGAKYPVRVDPFIEQAQLTVKHGTTEERFGFSVAVSDGTAVVGAPHQAFPQPREPSTDTYPGAVYVFQQKGNSWKQVAELTAPDGAANALGWSVAISESGSTIVAGAPGPPSASNPCASTEGNLDPGQAYVYSMPAGGWKNASTATATLTSSEACVGEALGWSVGISGNTIVAGAPWAPTANVGEPRYLPVTGQGVAYEYTMPAGGWKSMTQTAELTAGPAVEDAHLGWSVAVSGETVVAGDPEQRPETAYVFVKPTGEWKNETQTAKLTQSDGKSGEEDFAESVAISGNTIVAGSQFHSTGSGNGKEDVGAAYVYVKPPTGWANGTQTAELTASPGESTARLGYSVAVSGETVVAGAYYAHSLDEGAAFVFKEPSGGWSGSQTQSAELSAADRARGEYFGYSVAVSGNTIVAGAPERAAGETQKVGAAYVFGAPLPAVKKLSPKKGPTAGGTPVTITGTNFTGVTAVKFGSTGAKIDASSETSITVETPAEPAGKVAVSVTTPDGTSAPSSKAEFTFDAPKK